jgi:DNA-binding NarL/FixJ family response regulator
MKGIRILIVDDHRLLLDTWQLLLNADARFQVVGTTTDTVEVIPLIATVLPDIVLVDIAMTPVDGFQLTRQITGQQPHPLVIGVSLYKTPAFAKKLILAGARGYVTKNSSKEELVEAIWRVSAGEKYICREIKNYMAGGLFNGAPDAEPSINMLTRRELNIIELIKKGLTSKEIAKQEYISLKTVEVHRYNIFRKLKVNNTAALVNLAHAYGL